MKKFDFEITARTLGFIKDGLFDISSLIVYRKDDMCLVYDLENAVVEFVVDIIKFSDLKRVINLISEHYHLKCSFKIVDERCYVLDFESLIYLFSMLHNITNGKKLDDIDLLQELYQVKVKMNMTKLTTSPDELLSFFGISYDAVEDIGLTHIRGLLNKFDNDILSHISDLSSVPSGYGVSIVEGIESSDILQLELCSPVELKTIKVAIDEVNSFFLYTIAYLDEDSTILRIEHLFTKFGEEIILKKENIEISLNVTTNELNIDVTKEAANDVDSLSKIVMADKHTIFTNLIHKAINILREMPINYNDSNSK